MPETAAGISLRRATVNDLSAVLAIMGHPEVLANLMQLPYASESLWKERLTELNSGTKADLMLLAERNGQVVGSCGLHTTPNVRRRHTAMLGISVLPQAQGQGVGSALMQGLCDYADRWAHLLRIELDVYTDNHRAIRLYDKFGFVLEGTHRAYALRDGVYVDSHSMARLHPNPPQLPRAQ
jgi:putative acetyltransferase